MVVNHPSPKGLQICQAMFPVPVTTRLGRDVWRQGSTSWGVSRSRVSLQHARQDHLTWKSTEGKERVMLQQFGVPCFQCLVPICFCFGTRIELKHPQRMINFNQKNTNAVPDWLNINGIRKYTLKSGGWCMGGHPSGAWRLGGRILMKLKGKVAIANEGF